MILTFLKNIYLKFLLIKANSEGKSQIYRKHFNIKIGNNVRYTGLPIWGSEPYLIEIGDNVTITQAVTFHTHDGGVGILREKYPGINVFGKIKIGNNVFIGSNTIFLPGVSVGDNVVIGAGSIVTNDIPSNCVSVGVPAKVIKTIEQYEEDILKKAIYVNRDNLNERKRIILKNFIK